MKKLSYAAVLLLSCGCSTMNNTQAGAVGGGIFGGILGTFVGIVTGHPVEGMAIGAAAGAGTGALIGHAEDRDDKRRAQAAAYAIQHPALPIDEICRLSQNRISDDVIIQQINHSGSVYQLGASDIEFLKQQGVSDRVVIFMQSRRPGMVQVGPPPAPGVVIIDHGPPPPVIGVGIGVGGPRYRRW